MAREFQKISFKTFAKSFEGYSDAIIQNIYDNIKYPIRKTTLSAGYDFFSPINIILEPNDSFIIPTGIKAKMENDEFLAIFIRSSLGIKKDLVLKNGTGIIDADYFNNPNNEGHILIAVKNTGKESIEITTGEGIAQGIFLNYLVTDNDQTNNKRIGGIGSTDYSLRLEKAKIKDAHELLNLQKMAFKKYLDKYGPMDYNPYNMSLHRMEFNIRYRLGDYQKIILNDELIGGIFAFSLDDSIDMISEDSESIEKSKSQSSVWKLAQLYINPKYEHLGIGSKMIEEYFKLHSDVKEWYTDTILQEEDNVKFYKKHGFEVIDIEDEHEGLSFATLYLNRK